ncbi:HopJ type III effector protein [Marinomonas sp. 15G1-11]|uniref:HopJ type III effector protein n=1 Tax=Marinomonas phaeophyticola TaxID=3004091 RepID=A0ABT4JX88_9GAMM|nr:HopJ type III effector protein [Marinomonas sp. 15G1-11]MCZ2722836.1 HopJ type III effector protein [Marinomonas sp. 15G1-11]
MLTTDSLIELLKSNPEQVSFNQSISTIDKEYDFVETKFVNGSQINEAGKNNGSCKILAFAMLNQLSQQETLHLFGDYYRKDVLEHPLEQDHQNIRQFIEGGWDAVQFEAIALTPKP